MNQPLIAVVAVVALVAWFGWFALVLYLIATRP